VGSSAHSPAVFGGASIGHGGCQRTADDSAGEPCLLQPPFAVGVQCRRSRGIAAAVARLHCAARIYMWLCTVCTPSDSIEGQPWGSLRIFQERLCAPQVDGVSGCCQALGSRGEIAHRLLRCTPMPPLNVNDGGIPSTWMHALFESTWADRQQSSQHHQCTVGIFIGESGRVHRQRVACTWVGQSGVRGTVGVCCLGAVCVCVCVFSELC